MRAALISAENYTRNVGSPGRAAQGVQKCRIRVSAEPTRLNWVGQRLCATTMERITVSAWRESIMCVLKRQGEYSYLTSVSAVIV
jgi:hypothetical protein